MKRGQIFELTLVLLIIVLACLLYVLTLTTPPEITGWTVKGGWNPDYMTIGSNDTLYEFKGNEVYTGVRDLVIKTKGNEIRAIGNDGNQLWTLEIPPEWSVLNRWELPGTTPEGSGYSLWSYPMFDESEGSLYIFAFKRLTREDIDPIRYEAESELNISYNNTTYVYTRPANQYISKPCKIMKISPDGSVAWEYPFNMSLCKWNIGGLTDPGYVSFDHPVKITEQSDRIYVFHDYTEDVLDKDGRLLFSIRNISDPAVVDNSGHIYAVHGESLRAYSGQNISADGRIPEGVYVDGYLTKMASDPDFLIPTSIVEAYDYDGKLLWSTDIGYPAARQLIKYDVWSRYYTLPLYANDTLYVPIYNGVAAVDRDGNLKWITRPLNGRYVLYDVMPIDSKGNVYLRRAISSDSGASFLQLTYLVVVGPDGRTSSDAWPFYQYDPVIGEPEAPLVLSGNDGIVYTTGAIKSAEMNMIESKAFDQIVLTRRYPADTITAYDVKNRKALWHFTIPKSDVNTVTINRNNAATILRYVPGEIGELNGSNYVYGDGTFKTEAYPLKPMSTNIIRVLPGENVVYIDYYYCIVETHLIVNLSRCVYAKGLYTVDNNGNLLCKQQIDGFVTGTAVNNSTIYYRTSDGTMGKGTVNVMAGIAIAALVYLVLRFLVLGTVSRAKSRLDKNENRNQVLDYIIAHPGSTTYEIVRGLKMNLGTIRYHLLVLSLNHKVVVHQDGGKYIRYFKNSGSFTQEERSLLSLMRREPVRRTLKALAQKPGISGAELSKELGISDTAAYKNVNLLVEKGIVSKETRGDRGYVYSVIDEYRPFIVGVTEQ